MGGNFPQQASSIALRIMDGLDLRYPNLEALLLAFIPELLLLLIANVTASVRLDNNFLIAI